MSIRFILILFFILWSFLFPPSQVSGTEGSEHWANVSIIPNERVDLSLGEMTIRFSLENPLLKFISRVGNEEAVFYFRLLMSDTADLIRGNFELTFPDPTMGLVGFNLLQPLLPGSLPIGTSVPLNASNVFELMYVASIQLGQGQEPFNLSIVMSMSPEPRLVTIGSRVLEVPSYALGFEMTFENAQFPDPFSYFGLTTEYFVDGKFEYNSYGSEGSLSSQNGEQVPITWLKHETDSVKARVVLPEIYIQGNRTEKQSIIIWQTIAANGGGSFLGFDLAWNQTTESVFYGHGYIVIKFLNSWQKFVNTVTTLLQKYGWLFLAVFLPYLFVYGARFLKRKKSRTKNINP